MSARLQSAFDKIRLYALDFPEAYEEFPWGHSAFKINKKAFAFSALGDRKLTLSLKLPSSGFVALDLPFATPTGYGLGKSGWVTASFAPKDKIPIPVLMEWIMESYRAIAPKRLAKSV